MWYCLINWIKNNQVLNLNVYPLSHFWLFKYVGPIFPLPVHTTYPQANKVKGILFLTRLPLLPLSLWMNKRRWKHRKLSMTRLSKKWARNSQRGWSSGRRFPWFTCQYLPLLLPVFSGWLDSSMQASCRPYKIFWKNFKEILKKNGPYVMCKIHDTVHNWGTLWRLSRILSCTLHNNPQVLAMPEDSNIVVAATALGQWSSVP